MPTDRQHDLVIGGTGMLAGLCLALAQEGRQVSVIARDAGKLDHLAQAAPAGAIRPISLDYCDVAALRAGLLAAIDAAGPIQRAICWVHGEQSEDVPLVIADLVTGFFCHVHGSATADPARPELIADWQRRFFARRRGLPYQIVILGFIREAIAGSRWLSNDEISDGVKGALDSREPLSVVGLVSPWSACP
jgi:NAD(P)-dependent dehydrogenase (short-subunit alcohol dehydrogenase family)